MSRMARLFSSRSSGVIRGEPVQTLRHGPGQAGLLEKELSGPGRDDEARRDGRIQKFMDEGEIGGLAPALPDHVRAQGLQGQHQFPRRQQTARGKDGRNFLGDAVKTRESSSYLPRDKAVQGLHQVAGPPPAVPDSEIPPRPW